MKEDKRREVRAPSFNFETIVKNRITAAILALILGGFGAHKFYLGKTSVGFVYIILFFLGISPILGIIEGVKYLLMSDESFAYKYSGIASKGGNNAFKDALYTLLGVNGQLYIYENRAIIERKGMFGTLTAAASGAKTIPFKAIQTVQFRDGGNAINGFIQFGVLGGNESTGGIIAATGDENTVIFKKSENTIANEIKKFIESKIY